MKKQVLFGAALFVLVGCGEDINAGSNSLQVEAHAHTAGTRASNFFAVQVREEATGRVVSHADVRVRGADDSEWEFDYLGASWGPISGGLYLLQEFEWQPGWHLEIEVDDEHWLEVYLDCPGITKVFEPIANTAYRPEDGDALTVRWEDLSGNSAERVEISLSRNDRLIELEGDPGRHEIPAAQLGTTGSERLVVERFTEVELLGGTGDSMFYGSSEHGFDFMIE